MSRPDEPRERPAIGWREWVTLPDLGIPAIKAKIDTGARTSSLHAFDVRITDGPEGRTVRFKVHPNQRDTTDFIVAEAALVDERQVRDSGGRQTRRPVILTTLELLGERVPIELTLASRDSMGFRMLLGRRAVAGRFVVDPGRSFFGGRPGRPRRRPKTDKSEKGRSTPQP